MPITLESLGLDRLPRADRLRLLHDLWESLAGETPPPFLTTAQQQELERRADEDDASPDDVVPWEAVKARGRSRMSR